MTMFWKSWLEDHGFRQYLAALCWNLGGMNLGIFLGWASVATPMLQNKENPALGHTPVSDIEISYSNSLPFLAGICFSFVWGYIANIVGRKMTGYLLGLCYIMCYVLVIKTDSVNVYILSRVIGGAAYCGVMFNGPMYIAEIAETQKIGRLSSLYLIVENMGTLIIYVIGSLFDFYALNVFSLAIAVLYFVSIVIFPESPVFYIKNDRLTEAKLSLQWYRPRNDCLYLETELQRLKNTFVIAKKFKVKYLFTKHTSMGLIIALALQLGVQTAGINYITGYTVTIFMQTSNVFDPYTCTVITGFLNAIAPVFYFIITNKFGRKVILIMSYIFQCIILGTLGCYYFYTEHEGQDSNPMFNFVPVLFLSLYFLAYSAGAGPIPFTIYSEIFSSEVRNAVVPFIYIWNALTAFLIMQFVPVTLYQAVHMSGVFWFFSLCTLCTAIFTLVFVPETRNVPFLRVMEKLSKRACW